MLHQSIHPSHSFAFGLCLTYENSEASEATVVSCFLNQTDRKQAAVTQSCVPNRQI